MADDTATPAAPAPAAAPITTPAATPPTGTAPVAAPPAEAAKRDPVSATLAEINRKEAQFRSEKKRFDDERKSAAQQASERAAKDAERAELEETFKTDAQTLLEHYGWTTDAVIDFLAKGGATSPEGQVRALKLQIAADKKADAEAKAKAEAEAQTAAAHRAYSEAVQTVHGECKRLLADPRFEYCAGTEGIEDEVVSYIGKRWARDQEDISPEQALSELEAVLDTRVQKYAQSQKLKAKLGQPAPDGANGDPAKPDVSRQNPSVPSATNQRTITIKQRQQAVAPIRLARDGRAPRSEISREVSANLAALLQR